MSIASHDFRTAQTEIIGCAYILLFDWILAGGFSRRPESTLAIGTGSAYADVGDR